MKKAAVPVKVKRILAGKFRRYNGIHWLQQVAHLPTTLRNIRDILYTGIGLLQSLFFLLRVRPNVVFAKGGYVCLPVGIAAHWLRIPLVLHDSDAHPGLTNRLLARYAVSIATGSPTENYAYPKERTHYVGIPVDASFHPITKPQEKAALKAGLGFKDPKKPLIAVTGGGLGARNVNRAITTIAPQLLPQAAILHVAGEYTYEETKAAAVKHPDYIVKPFISTGMAEVFGAADIVVTRAGATALQELAAMAKPIILIPNPLLTGGHQLKNASIYEAAHAALVVDENKMVVNPLYLKKAIELLLKNPQKTKEMARRLHAFARPNAAVDVAALVAEAAAARTYQKKAAKR